MNSISVPWSIFILILTILIYVICKKFLNTSRQKALLICFCITIFLYSGIGIAYPQVDKFFIVYYFILILVVAITYTFIVHKNVKIIFSHARISKIRCIDDFSFWNNKNTKKTFEFFFALYIMLRIISVVYPINRLSNFSLVFNSANNINNLIGANVTWIDTICAWIQPLYFIGLFYVCKKVRYIALALGIDLFITLINTGYLSRYKIVVTVIICLLLYFNGDLNDGFISKTKKRRRIIVSVAIIGPILLYLMLVMMEARITSGATFTVTNLIESEVGYPLQYNDIQNMAPISTPKDFFLQLLDSFVPIFPTPNYHMDLNVDFSQLYLGYGINVAWFSVLLPSVLGESFLIFGNYFFWIHGIIIGCLVALAYKMTRENKYTVILFYYYLTCVLTTGRAGYEQLSQSVLLNYVIFMISIHLIRYFIKNRLILRKFRIYNNE